MKNNVIKLFKLVSMQMKDKLDMTWIKSGKKIVQKIVFGIVKFALVFALVYLFLSAGQFLGVFYYSESIRICILIITLMFALSLIQCTVGITEALYFSEDNKVLVTLPCSGTILFLSKLLIFYINELKKALFFTIPIILACFIFSHVNWPTYFWMIIPMLFYIALPVLLGALLSILYMLLKRLFIRVPIIELIFAIAILSGVIYGIVYLIELIPQDINLVEQWGEIRAVIRESLLFLEKDVYIFAQFVYSLIGEITVSGEYVINWLSFAKVMILIGGSIVLLIICMLVLKPLFFYMMTKNFEFDKKGAKKNPKYHAYPYYLAFLGKEFKLKFRDKKFYTNYVLMYIAVPIFILLLNRIFIAMSTNYNGEILSYFFNILLIVLPMLASNAKIASEYSREGRSAYIKKTKPVRMYFGLTAKLFYNLLLSAISIIVSCSIVYRYSQLTLSNISLLCFAIILLDYCHIFWAARLDLNNPQNEQYATVGNVINDVNENKTTILAFVISIIFALFATFLIYESSARTQAYDNGILRILILCGLMFIASFALYIYSIKAYYVDK